MIPAPPRASIQEESDCPAVPSPHLATRPPSVLSTRVSGRRDSEKSFIFSREAKEKEMLGATVLGKLSARRRKGGQAIKGGLPEEASGFGADPQGMLPPTSSAHSVIH